MKCFTFQPELTEKCTVTAWLQEEPDLGWRPLRALPAVLICPGGAYEFVSAREAEPVAKPYFAAGYHVFILDYAVGADARDFRPLLQLSAAMLHLRAHAAEWKLDAGKIAVCGFSAGGHLAASLGTLYNEEKFLAAAKGLWGGDFQCGAIRPDAMILGYPVILADRYAHVDSIQNVSGAREGSPEYTWFGLDAHVDASTPPTYLWHTAPDGAVPVENSLRFAAALSAAKVPFELHVFPAGDHGMSTCTEEVGPADPYNARWVEWSLRWLEKVFGFQK